MQFITFILSVLLTPLIFVILGVSVILISLKEVWRARRAKHWLEITATILDVKIKKQEVGRPSRYPEIRHRTLYQMIVSYGYSVDGKHYRDRQLFWGDTGVASSRNAIEQRLSKYQSGRQFSAYYNPRKPQKSTLEREVHNNTDSVLMLGSLALLMGLFFCVLILPSAMKTCGISPTSTDVPPGAPPWCERAMKGAFFW